MFCPTPAILLKLAAVAMACGKRTLPVGFGSPLITRDDLDRYYSAALSVEWPSGWMPVSMSDLQVLWPIAVSFLVRPLDECLRCPRSTHLPSRYGAPFRITSPSRRISARACRPCRVHRRRFDPTLHACMQERRSDRRRGEPDGTAP
jgi:hypothetical protein